MIRKNKKVQLKLDFKLKQVALGQRDRSLGIEDGGLPEVAGAGQKRGTDGHRRPKQFIGSLRHAPPLILILEHSGESGATLCVGQRFF